MNKSMGWRMTLLILAWAAAPSAQAEDSQRQAIIQELTGDISSSGEQAMAAVSVEAAGSAVADTAEQVAEAADLASQQAAMAGSADAPKSRSTGDSAFRGPSTQTAGDCVRGSRREVLAPNR